LPYRFTDHSRYIEGFIDKMKLTNITLVIHDWGSGLGFHYAMRHESNIRGIAFMEAMVKTFDWDDLPKEVRTGFRMMRTPVIGWFLISVANIFVKKILPMSIVRDLTEEETRHYEAPFKTVASRRPVRRWPQEIPIAGKPKDMHEIISSYSDKLKLSEIPKLLFHATPGAIIGSGTLEWCKKNIRNLKTVDIGEGIHYLQEDNPHLIGEELAKWYKTL
jgi:haloalkane dehalogenase